MAYRFPWPSRRHPTHQRLLVREIQHRYNDIEEQIKDLQSNTSDWALARVERFAGTTGKVLSYARTGLNDPSDVDEFTAVSRMVEKLEDITDSSTAFHFTADGKNYSLFGHPRHFILYHVYLANSAAICALIITGELSMIVVALIDRAFGKLPRSIYYLWFSLLVPTLVLTGVALVYVFAAEHSQKAQIINTALAVSENGRPYTRGTWTPHAWFSAVLGLDISALERKEILREVAMMKVWQYNLIPSE
ncbi:hypothetical protein F5B17DRAFT_448571 [Nemania serpens]|nr:hypothetical protein F5B17DRAFT_448571 [Nemania serpens]